MKAFDIQHIQIGPGHWLVKVQKVDKNTKLPYIKLRPHSDAGCADWDPEEVEKAGEIAKGLRLEDHA